MGQAENNITKRIKDFLKSKNIWHVKYFANAFTAVGVPDILACVKGHFVGIEVKTDIGRLSEIQKYQADKITNKSKEGEDYETYQSIYNKVKEAFELEKVNKEKYSLEDFMETIINDLDWQTADNLITEYIESLDDEYFLDYNEELENE